MTPIQAPHFIFFIFNVFTTKRIYLFTNNIDSTSRKGYHQVKIKGNGKGEVGG